MKKHLCSTLFFLIGLMSLTACETKESFEFEIRTKSHQGVAIADAEVRVNGEQLGISSDLGYLKKTIEYPLGTKLRVEVFKEDEAYFYAPFIKTVTLDENHILELKLDATLYHIPKESDLAEEEEDGEEDGEEDDQLPDENLALKPEPALEKETSQVAELEAEVALEEGVESSEQEFIQELQAIEEQLEDGAEQEPIDVADGAEESQESVSIAKLDKEPVTRHSDAPLDDVIADFSVSPTSAAFFSDDSYPSRINSTVTEVVADGVVETKAGTTVEQSEVSNLVKFVVYQSKRKAIANAKIYFGGHTKLGLSLLCTTSKQGICEYTFPSKRSMSGELVVKADGYVTRKISASLYGKAKKDVLMSSGTSVDIYAVTKRYSFVNGVKNVSVFIDGRFVGTTNKYGHFSYNFKGDPDDLIRVGLKSSELLPETYETSLIVSERLSLIKYFTPQKPNNIRIAVLKPYAEFKIENSMLEGLRDKTSISIKNHPMMESVSRGIFGSLANLADASVQQLLRRGWDDLEIKSRVDMVLYSRITSGRELELTLHSSDGKVVAAAKQRIGNSFKEVGQTQIDSLLQSAAEAVAIEASVVTVDRKNITINLGSAAQVGAKRGQLVSLYGAQLNKKGTELHYLHIAEAKIKSVSKDSIEAVVFSQLPRSMINPGDLALLVKQEALKVVNKKSGGLKSSHTIMVVDQESKPLAGASIYINGTWAAATNQDGKAAINKDYSKQKIDLEVSKYGFQSNRSEVTLTAGTRVVLGTGITLLSIDSNPTGANVFVDQEKIGKTPIAEPVSISKGFKKVRVSSGYPYIDYVKVFDLTSDNLDLTGAMKIELQKDLLAMSRKALAAGDVARAKSILAEIPATHAQYLDVQHFLGTIALNKEQDFSGAIKFFERVVHDPAVASFVNKRFIPSHLNLGLSYYHQGAVSTLKKDLKVEFFAKAITKLKSLESQLRFLSEDEYAKAAHHIHLYKGIAMFKLGLLENSMDLIATAKATWRNYLDALAPALKYPGSQSLEDLALVYLKQANQKLATAEKKEQPKKL